MTTTFLNKGVLTDEMLERFGSRAAGYDRDNRFALEDFNELKDAGYLKMPIPTELGGLGIAAGVCLSSASWLCAPGNRRAINMPYWMGVAADLWRAGTTLWTLCCMTAPWAGLRRHAERQRPAGSLPTASA